MVLRHFQAKSADVHTTYLHTRGPNCHQFQPTMSPLFELWPSFGKSAPIDLKTTSTFIRSEVPMCICHLHVHMPYAIKAQMFVLLFDKPFPKHNFEANAPILSCSRLKYPNAYYIQGPRRLALQWAIFELRPNFEHSSPNDPQNDHDIIKVKRTHLHMSYMYDPKAKSCPFDSPRWTVFVLLPNYEKSALNDHNMTLTCPRHIVWSKPHVKFELNCCNSFEDESTWWTDGRVTSGCGSKTACVPWSQLE